MQQNYSKKIIFSDKKTTNVLCNKIKTSFSFSTLAVEYIKPVVTSLVKKLSTMVAETSSTKTLLTRYTVQSRKKKVAY